MNLTKALLVCAIVATAGAIGLASRVRMKAKRSALALRSNDLQQSQQRVADLRNELNRLSRAVSNARPALKHTKIAAAASARALEQTHPESRWAEPPAAWPQWNSESPYVWVRKEMLPRLPNPGFTKTGDLDPELAEALALSPAEQMELNARLQACLDRYRAVETNAADVVEDHLPGIAGQEGEKRTVRINPQIEWAMKARAEFELILDVILGEQRATLVRQRGEGWLDSQFNIAESEPKTISLLRMKDGGFSISVRSGGQWMSTGMPKEYADRIGNYIPPHLLPFFADMLETAR